MKTRTIQAREQVTVRVSPHKAWSVLAEDFAGIGTWASGVDRAVGHSPTLEGAFHSERHCQISAAGFADTKERITHFEPQRVLRYELFDGLPSFVVRAHNTWTIAPFPMGTTVTAETVMEVEGLLGFLAGPLMRISLSRVLRHMAEELEHFLETDLPHPRKRKAQARYERKRARSVQ